MQRGGRKWFQGANLFTLPGLLAPIRLRLQFVNAVFCVQTGFVLAGQNKLLMKKYTVLLCYHCWGVLTGFRNNWWLDNLAWGNSNRNICKVSAMDYGLLLWEEPIKSWGCNHWKWPNGIRFVLLLLLHITYLRQHKAKYIANQNTMQEWNWTAPKTKLQKSVWLRSAHITILTTKGNRTESKTKISRSPIKVMQNTVKQSHTQTVVIV